MTTPKVIRKIENPPALDINAVLYGSRKGQYGNGEMPGIVRLEQRIVWNLLLTLEAAGFVPHSVWNGEEKIIATNKRSAMLYFS